MAIVNRDLDSSEQLFKVGGLVGAVATGVSAAVGLVPSPGQALQMVLTAVSSISATPVYQLAVARWTSAGITRIAIGGAVTLAGIFGLSGGVVGTTYAADSSLGSLQAGDLLLVNSSGANSAAAGLVVEVVIKATQDIKKTYSVG